MSERNEAQERSKTAESPEPSGVPAAGMTQEMSKAEILAYLEKMKKEGAGK